MKARSQPRRSRRLQSSSGRAPARPRRRAGGASLDAQRFLPTQHFSNACAGERDGDPRRSEAAVQAGTHKAEPHAYTAAAVAGRQRPDPEATGETPRRAPDASNACVPPQRES